MTYEFLDSGWGRKLERFGDFILSRPSAQAVWEPCLSENVWDEAHAVFSRESENRWELFADLPDFWEVTIQGIRFKIQPTDFGHVGVFPEQQMFWSWLQNELPKMQTKLGRPAEILNLFAYSGGSTLAAAKAGANVCHLDASKGMVTWANENAELNKLKNAPIRWIVDDVAKFMKRELRRERKYDGIILDPPSFGRGSKGEIFKIEGDIVELLSDCRALLSDTPLFIFFSCHTPGFTPLAMHHLLTQALPADTYRGKIESGEMTLDTQGKTFPLPSGTFAKWYAG